MVGIVGARTGLWVVLHPEDRLLAMGKGRNGSIVEIQMGDLHLIGRERVSVQGETVVLAGDFHHTGGPARVVQTAVASQA